MMSVAAKKGLQYWFQRAESDPITAAAIAAELDKEISASSGSEPTLAYRKVSFSSAFSKNNPDLHYPYELVGIVVHSGQANAGHYYSYIKERRSHLATGGRNKNRWFKFNDTTVEDFEMTDENIMNECFGGSYKVKKTGTAPNLPEDRQRYWNAYMLFYESRVEKKSAKTPRRSASHSQHLQRASLSHRKISMPVGPSSNVESPAPKESLSQLSDLLEKSEKKSLFASRMPSAIERGIQEENLRFLQNRDVFCEDYYQFICQLINANRSFAPPPPPKLFDVKPPLSNALTSSLATTSNSSSVLSIESVRLGVHFLMNSYYHVKKRDRQTQNEILGHIEAIIEKNRNACEWLLHFLADDGLQYMRTLLLECDAREVRVNFSNLIERTFHYYKKFNGETESDDVNRILATLVALIEKDVANNCKSSGQFFWILAKFAKMGVRQCQQLFGLNAFRIVIKFLLNVDPEPEEDEATLLARQRRWTVSQSREFGELHSLLAHLILSCDTRPHRSCAPDDVEEMEAKLPANRVFGSADAPLPEMPSSVSSVLYGKLAQLYIREAVCASREVTVSIEPIVDALVQVSYCCQKFSKFLVEEIMRQYNNVNSGELKNLSTLLVEILILSDPLQQERLTFVIDGDTTLKSDGLLTLIKNNQSSDTCRSYQCIKILVNAANKSHAVKDKLLDDSDRWQWAVNWLKNKMGTGNDSSVTSSTSSNYWNTSSSLSPSTTSDVVSNEDPTTRTFHRTTSALLTLEDANAILAEFDRPGDESMDTGHHDEDEMPDLMLTSGDLNNENSDP